MRTPKAPNVARPVSACVHHWLLQPNTAVDALGGDLAAPRLLGGVCKRCGEQRPFFAAYVGDRETAADLHRHYVKARV